MSSPLTHSRCVACGVPLVSRHGEVPDGFRRHMGRGLCSACCRGTSTTIHGHFEDQPWADRALCSQTDPEAFFPDKGGSTRAAKAVCAACPVRTQCLDWALATEQRFGIFGGTSERERRKLKKTGVPAFEHDEPVLAATGTDTPTVVSRGVYISGTSHRPIPMAPNPLSKLAPPARKQTGLDWSKHTAPEPTPKPAAATKVLRCRWCRKPADDLVDDVCGVCRADAEQHFHAPETTPHIVPSPKPPTEDNQGKPTTGSSAPGATSTSSTTGRAPVAGPSTHREKRDPEAAQETRPAAAPGTPTPAAAQALDELIDAIAQIRATTTTELARIENSLEQIRQQLLPAPVATPAPQDRPLPGPERCLPSVATGTTPATPRPRRRTGPNPRVAQLAPDIVRGYVEHHETIPQIATRVGLAKSTIRRVLVASDVRLRDDRGNRSGGRNRITPDQDDPQLVAHAKRLYLDEQQSLVQVAEQIGRSAKYVNALLRRHGVTLRPPASAAPPPQVRKLTDAQVDDICRRYQAGESGRQLAEAFDVSQPTILARLRERGITLRNRGGHARHDQTGAIPA